MSRVFVVLTAPGCCVPYGSSAIHRSTASRSGRKLLLHYLVNVYKELSVIFFNTRQPTFFTREGKLESEWVYS